MYLERKRRERERREREGERERREREREEREKESEKRRSEKTQRSHVLVSFRFVAFVSGSYMKTYADVCAYWGRGRI